jgi:hypothetical protein
MNYPARKPKKQAPEGGRGEDRHELKLAEYAAPLGEEMPWRTATSDLPDFTDRWRDLKPERGTLH